MPDIGLLQGSRPRIVPPPAINPEVMPKREVAAPFIAPVASAIAIVAANSLSMDPLREWFTYAEPLHPRQHLVAE